VSQGSQVRKRPRVLVVDVGGTNVKFKIWGREPKLSFPSGKQLTPRKMLEQLKTMTAGWAYDVVSIGIPCAVIHGRIAENPPLLGRGWVGFDFKPHLKKPVRVINDAAMQALGSYRGGRMLFIGLGTGLGSALILDDVIVPLELGELAFSKTKTLAEKLGKAGLSEAGARTWEAAIHRVTERLAAAFRTDYVVIGGGNAKLVEKLPPKARRGSNEKAFDGGARLWGVLGLKATPRKHTWVIT